MDMCSEEVLKHRDKEVEERVLMLKAYHAVDVKSIDQSINEAIYLSIYLSGCASKLRVSGEHRAPSCSIGYGTDPLFHKVWNRYGTGVWNTLYQKT